jgi:coproporphyrinogen III oxidase
MVDYVRDLQNRICLALEKCDGRARFTSKSWQRDGGGGGESRVLESGEVFEKAGVNVSVVHGQLPSAIQKKFGSTSPDFFATGLSLVLHPASPMVPTVHANYRYFEQPDRAWFGGGADLTPYVWSEEDFRHFHRTHKEACDRHSLDFYPRYKSECDKYFWNEHRSEARGIGGIFFDYLSEDLNQTFDFVRSCGDAFIDSYVPIVERSKEKMFTPRQKKFQLLRRGRYVEFNLVYDRGTLFGLQTKGNIESILMSLPPVVHFDYCADMEANDEEKALTACFKQPRSWL